MTQPASFNILGYDRYILLIPFLMWCLLPALSFSLLWRLSVVAGLGGYLTLVVLEVFLLRKFLIRKITLILIVALFYMWATNMVFSPPEYQLRHLHFSVLLIFIVISLQLMSASQKTAKLILGTIMLANALTLFVTIQALLLDHNIARLISKSNAVTEVLAAQGVGGYGIVYANVVMLPVLLAAYRILSNQRPVHFFLLLLTAINFILCILFLINSQYLIANLVAFATLIVILIRRSLLMFIMMLAAGFAFLASTSFLSDLEILINLLEGTRYKEKLLDVIDMSSGTNESGEAFGSRYDSYMISIDTFKDNTLFGILSFGKGIGHHSDIVDKFAQWGVILGCVIVYLLSYFPVYLRRKMRNQIGIEIELVLFSILAIATLNTIPMEVSVPFVMLSCIYVIYSSNHLQSSK